ncbi:MAG: hypothetical protein A2Y01_03790 [Omnitrophica WOR_2 bacterium GWC2_44_8]|nr:MAG: hypothetical protein A2Y01_03790 [Omnitrophica WOR_2 bacterium GWC2_44_8]
MISNYFIRKVMVLGVCVILAAGFLKIAFAHEATRRVEEETREKLLATESAEPQGRYNWGFDYGGWVNFLFIDYTDDDNNAALAYVVDYAAYFDVRPWIKITFTELSQRQHAVYARMKDLRSNLRPKETAGGSDHDGPHLDYGYCLLDFSPLWIKAGRQYFSVGQGLAYSDVNDGIEASLVFPRAKIKGFFARTLPHQENIDISIPGYDKSSQRAFYGLQYDYTGFTSHTLYGYVVTQRDSSEEQPEDTEHDYTYDSLYVGAGARGSFPYRVSYWLEGIKESGRSFIYESNSKKDIDGSAGILALSYDPAIYSHPSIFFKYAYGSGDKERVSVTDTFGGNASGKDRNFLYFGYIPSGYALAPRLSNLYFFKTGFTLKPLEKIRLFKNCFLGVDYYRYYKARKSGGIYDTDALGTHRDIGYEVDATLNWDMFSDLNCAVRYGYFSPGKAYSAEAPDNERYFSISASILF